MDGSVTIIILNEVQFSPFSFTISFLSFNLYPMKCMIILVCINSHNVNVYHMYFLHVYDKLQYYFFIAQLPHSSHSENVKSLNILAILDFL